MDRATALLADVRLPPDHWSYACRWVAYIHTHRVTEVPINKTLPHFGDVVVMHHAFKKPPSFENRGTTGVCLGHDSRVAGGALVVSVVNGELKEVCSAKVRTLGEKVGQAWRLHVHPQDTTKAAYVNRKGEVKWSLHEIEVPTVEQCVKEDALEVQDIRELGLGWAWFMNDLRAFLPAWQEMELASPSPEEPVTQIEADVPIEPLALQADVTHLDLELKAYERPFAVTRSVPRRLFLTTDILDRAHVFIYRQGHLPPTLKLALSKLFGFELLSCCARVAESRKKASASRRLWQC